MDFALADLFAGDLDNDLGAASLEVSDLGLAPGLGDLGLGREHLLLPLEFFLFDMLGLLFVGFDLDVQSSGDSLCQCPRGWAQAFLDHSLVMVMALVVTMMMFLVVVTMMVLMMSLVVVDLVVPMMVLLVMAMELMMVGMVVVLVMVASVMHMNLDVPVVPLMMMTMMSVMANMMVAPMMLAMAMTMMVLMSTVVAMMTTSFVMMSTRAPMFVLSVEFFVVLFEASHQALFVDMVFMSMVDPLFDLCKAAME